MMYNVKCILLDTFEIKQLRVCPNNPLFGIGSLSAHSKREREHKDP